MQLPRRRWSTPLATICGSCGGGRPAALRWRGRSDHRRSGPQVFRRSIRGDQLCGGRRGPAGRTGAPGWSSSAGACHRCRPGADHQRSGVRRPRVRQVDYGRQRAKRSRPGSRGRGCRPGSSSRCVPKRVAGSGAGLATALKVVAVADADVKGAADDAAYVLERAVLGVSRLRRSGG